MPNIFIDTSVFITENFLEGNRLKQLFKLIEQARFRLVLPLITINEIKAQFRKRVAVAVQLHNELVNKWEIRPLRNYPTARQALKKLPKREEICAYFDVVLDRKLADLNTVILPYPVIDTEGIFKKYFNGESPFSQEGDKKHEFPDAFAVTSLERWCQENTEECIVLSKDGDFLNYENPYFIIPRDYTAFLNETLEAILQEERRLQILHTIYQNHREQIIQEITDWANENLEDSSLYNEHANYMEIHEIDVQSVEVELGQYEIMCIEPEKIQVELPSLVTIRVIIEIDDPRFAYRDEDDRSMHFPSTTNVTINTSFETIPTLEFNIKSDLEFEDKVDFIDYGGEIDLSPQIW